MTSKIDITRKITDAVERTSDSSVLTLLRDCSMESRRALAQRKGGRPLKDSTLT